MIRGSPKEARNNHCRHPSHSIGSPVLTKHNGIIDCGFILAKDGRQQAQWHARVRMATVGACGEFCTDRHHSHVLNYDHFFGGLEPLCCGGLFVGRWLVHLVRNKN